MAKTFKILSRVVLVLGLVVLSFKPSIVNRVTPSMIHPHHVAFSKFTSLSKREPLSVNGAGLRCSFHKNEDKRHLPVAVVAVPAATVFAFNDPQSDMGTFSVSASKFSAPSQMVVLRI
jgi:hypothetical protein